MMTEKRITSFDCIVLTNAYHLIWFWFYAEDAHPTSECKRVKCKIRFDVFSVMLLVGLHRQLVVFRVLSDELACLQLDKFFA